MSGPCHGRGDWAPPWPLGPLRVHGRWRWARGRSFARTLLSLARGVLFGFREAPVNRSTLVGALSELIRRSQGVVRSSARAAAPEPIPPASWPGWDPARSPPPLLGEGLQGNYLLPPPPPSPLSYQLKHFRVQAKKPKSTLKKSLKGQNTNTREGIWRGLERRAGREECLASSNRLETTLVTLWARRGTLEESHCFQ